MKTEFRNRMIILVTVPVLAALAVLALCTGAVHVSPADMSAVLRGNREIPAAGILLYVRLPRLLGAVACGAALAVSGVLIQSVLHNPLGSPTIIGVNSGALLFVMISAAVLPHQPALIPSAAFCGALVTLFLVYALGRNAGSGRSGIVLAGVAVNAFCTALADMITVLVPDTVYSRNAWRIGSLAGVQMNVLLPAAGCIAAALVVTFLLSKELDVLSLGDETAVSFGLPVTAVRFAALVLAALLAGAGVSFAGLIGFVGLIVPHCARLLVGNEMKYLLPESALLGAVLVTLCDLIARTAFAPFEIPAGILLALLGGPFFVWLLISPQQKKRGGGADD